MPSSNSSQPGPVDTAFVLGRVPHGARTHHHHYHPLSEKENVNASSSPSPSPYYPHPHPYHHSPVTRVRSYNSDMPQLATTVARPTPLDKRPDLHHANSIAALPTASHSSRSTSNAIPAVSPGTPPTKAKSYYEPDVVHSNVATTINTLHTTASPSMKGVVNNVPRETHRKESPLDPLRRFFHAHISHGRGTPITSTSPQQQQQQQQQNQSNTSIATVVPPQQSPAPSVSTEGSLRDKYGRQCRVLGHGTGGTVRVFRRTVGGRPRISPFGGANTGGSMFNQHGSGGNGTLLGSTRDDTQVTKLYAVKEFRKRNPNEDQRKYIKRLTAEYCIASTLHHENIIETLDIVFENNRAYVVMDYCPHDLFYLLAGSHAPSASDGAIDCYFSQLLHGVGYLHQAGIAHLDLKLENCVVAPNGILKIIDFGCAEVVRAPWEMRTRQCEKAKGSQPYVAPEVYRSTPFNGQEADAWAVGVMFVCMVERHYPWRIARPSVDDSYRRYSEMRSVSDAAEEAAEHKMAALAAANATDAVDANAGEQSDEASLQAGSKEQRPHSLPPLASGNIAGYMRKLLPARPEAWRLISGLLNTQPSRRLTITEALNDPWARQIETCHDHHPATHHRHVGCEGPLIK